jgi:hypothetical protein
MVVDGLASVETAPLASACGDASAAQSARAWRLDLRKEEVTAVSKGRVVVGGQPCVR